MSTTRAAYLVRTIGDLVINRADDFDRDHTTTDHHRGSVPVEPSAADHTRCDPQGGLVGGSPTPAETMRMPTPIFGPSRLDYSLLALHADALDDFEETRIRTENRVRALRDYLPDDAPEVDRLNATLDTLRALEHGVELELKRSLRKHPLGAWVRATVGIGEKQGARLLAAIGDPYWNTLHDRPRTVSELWAYCGYHVLHPGQTSAEPHPRGAGVDPSSNASQSTSDIRSCSAGVAPSRARGQRANWNAAAKMRAFLVAESCIKQARSPYRKVYDDGRAKYADAVHQHECKRCGPSGKPAPVGSPLSLGHQHARALRLVAKEVLRDLWLESRRLQIYDGSHGAVEAAGS